MDKSGKPSVGCGMWGALVLEVVSSPIPWLNQQLEKYARQIGSCPENFGVKTKNH